ncbi:MAG TPA: hypothetical protein VMF06_06415 [Candidatus Limnocylindria bacterium]|nr:hypothetical protein [Candidatus Limnocylindria bacterium]
MRGALKAGATTPFYLFSPLPVRRQLALLERLDFGVPVTHWLSCKTQPLPALLEWWHRQNRPAEVVSELEYRTAWAAGFRDILVNGPAKQRWLPEVAVPGQRVHFDSLTELRALLPQAKRQQWRVGLRLCTSQEFDPGDPTLPTQFGFDPGEVPLAVKLLRKVGLEPQQVHFHLRTNVAEAGIYAAAAAEALSICAAARWFPTILDCGGGLPPSHTRSLDGSAYGASMNLESYAQGLRRVIREAGHIRELWLENGRFVLADSGLLAIRVLDIKERRGVRQILCDGGRTMNALISTWENHALEQLVPRRGVSLDSLVYGPTCMAFDRLARTTLPQSLKPGDVLLWMDAGAYHLPWETRFSHFLAEIWWERDSGTLACVRDAEHYAASRRVK